MKLLIPTTALISLLLQTRLQASSLNEPSDDYANDLPMAKGAGKSSGFTCNEPFMIPAEYIDQEGNNFAMCLSDPKFLKNRIVWYIQGLNGSTYKALGVAKRKGSSTYVGKVVPIEEPTFGSGMHADPVAVKVTLDRAAGVISVNPLNSSGSMVNWMVRPNGFPSGSLIIPDSCGPFLDTLPDGQLIAPLTGATESTMACILRLPKSDAFISWGMFGHEDTSALELEQGNEPRFLSVGFVDPDRGVSIDICDPGNDNANRCELSRLVGHVRKTFVVGKKTSIKQVKAKAKVNPSKKPKTKAPIKHKAHKKSHKKSRKEVKHEEQPESLDLDKNEPKSCDASEKHSAKKSKHSKTKDHKEKEHKHISSHKHEKQGTEKGNDILRKIDMIENDLREILDRSEPLTDSVSDYDDYTLKKSKKKKHGHAEKKHKKTSKSSKYKQEHEHDKHKSHDEERTKGNSSNRNQCGCNANEDAIDHPRVKEHRVKTCTVQHPLLYPDARSDYSNTRPNNYKANSNYNRSPNPQSQFYSNEYLKTQNAQLEQDQVQIRSRLIRLSAQIYNSESLITQKLKVFENSLKRLKDLLIEQAKEFSDFLGKLREDAVYTPAQNTKKRFISGFGKALRKDVKKPVNYLDDLKDKFTNSTTTVTSNSTFIQSLNDNIFDVIDPAVKAFNNTVIDPIYNEFSDYRNQTSTTATTAAASVNSPQVYPPTVNYPYPPPVANYNQQYSRDYPVVANGYQRFDYNDDLLPPARANLAAGPSPDTAAQYPLGPVGPVMYEPRQEDDPHMQAAMDYLN